MKRCSKCGEFKSLEGFDRNASQKDGRHGWCKECSREGRRDHYRKNREQVLARNKAYFENNRASVQAKRNEYWHLPHNRQRRNARTNELYKEGRRRAYFMEYYRRPEVKEKRMKITREWARRNRSKMTEYIVHRHRGDPEFRLRRNLARAVHGYIKRHGGVKAHATIELVGCSRFELRCFLEKRFKPGMAWDNYGKVWDVDHIVPCSHFNLQDKNQQRDCFHYSNLQPLFKEDNRRKSNRYIG